PALDGADEVSNRRIRRCTKHSFRTYRVPRRKAADVADHESETIAVVLQRFGVGGLVLTCDLLERMAALYQIEAGRVSVALGERTRQREHEQHQQQAEAHLRIIRRGAREMTI